MNKLFWLLLGSVVTGWIGLGWVLLALDPRAVALVMVHLALLAMAMTTRT